MVKMRKRKSSGLTDETKESLIQASRELITMSDVLRKMASQDVDIHDGLLMIGFPDPARGKRHLQRISENPLAALVPRAFKNRNLTATELDHMYLMAESPGMHLMRDVLEIPDDQFIDPDGFNEDMVWEFVSQNLSGRLLFVVEQRYNKGSILGFEKSAHDVILAAILANSEDLQVSIADREKIQVSTTRIYQLQAEAIRKLKQRARCRSNRKFIIKAMFGVDAEELARETYTVADFLMKGKKN